MKKFITDIRTLAALLMAGAAFTACSSSDDNIIDEQPVNPANKTYKLTLNAAKGDGTTTRALSLSDKTLTASWATTEHVYVKKESTWATGSLQPEANGTTTTLTGELSGITIVADDNLTLQFPKSGDITYAGQLGTLADIQANFDWATATVDVESVSPSGNINPKAATTTFTNQQAIIKFTLKDKANDAAISPSALTVTDGTSTVSLTSIPPATYSDPKNGAGVLYVAFPAAGSAKTITLTATVGDDTYTYTTSSAKTFVNGQYYEITVKMTKQAPTDLSMVDCAGNARANGMWTANCYMVHTAGKYKLPLVYGNAIKAGEANTVAYNPGGTTSNTYCANFVNHAGTDINAPWITKSTDGTGVNKGMGITVTEADLLWQDAQGLVTAVGISEDGDYLTLTVGKDATTQEGNALIAAKDADGTIVWSWHIWVTKQTFAAADLTTVATGSHDYKVTPVNLGWVGDDIYTGTNTFYQWGRKDPFKGTGDVTYDGSTTATIADNIKNPATFYDVNNKPSTAEYYNMWDAQLTSSSNDIATATKKTVYDPSPAGFCVPTIGLYSFIKNNASTTNFAWDGVNKGRNLTSVDPHVFFPASGCRNGSSGNLAQVGTFVNYWSATPNSGGGRTFYFASVSWGLSSFSRAMGCPVRAVAE